MYEIENSIPEKKIAKVKTNQEAYIIYEYSFQLKFIF